MFRKQFVNRWGARLAGGWFIFTGVIPLLDLHFLHMHTMMALLAIIAGILIILDV